MAKKRGNYKKKILLLFFSLIFAIFLFEAVLVLLDSAGFSPTFFEDLNKYMTPRFDTKGGGGLYYSHPYLSYDLKPNYNSSFAHINSLGFRGGEFSKKKQADKYRIVTLGSSTTYGTALSDKQTYPYLLEIYLNEIFGSNNIEVINGGLVDASSAEVLERFLFKVAPLEPDMIIIYGTADFFARAFNDYSDDYYHFRRSLTNNQLQIYFGEFYIYRIINRLLASKYVANVELTSQISKLENLPKSNGEKIRNFKSASSDAYKRNIQYIVDIAKSRNIKLVFATQAFNKDKKIWNANFPLEIWEMGINEQNQALKEIAKKNNITLIDFYKYALQDEAMFKDVVHMNHYGSEKQAEFFANRISPVVKQDLLDKNMLS